jgi:hypothetical protein
MSDPRPGDERARDPNRRGDNAEPLGGADAVEKTTYVTGKGTNPEAQRPPDMPAPIIAGRSNSPVIWVLLVFIILIAIAYGAGVFR